MSPEIEEALKEVLPFLKWHSPFDYKMKVLNHLLGMTGTSEGCSTLARHTELNKMLTDLVVMDRTGDIKEGRPIFLVIASLIIFLLNFMF